MGIVFYLVAALVIFGAGAGSAWKIEEWRYAAQAADRVVAQAAAQAAEDKRTNEIAGRFEKGLASLRANRAANETKVIHELAQAVYTQCVVPPSGVQLLDTTADDINRALGFAPAVPNAPAPAAKPAGSVDNGRSVPSTSGLDAAIRRLRDQAKVTGGSGGSSSGAGKSKSVATPNGEVKP